MTVYYILYFAGVAVALLLYIMYFLVCFREGIKEVPSLASVLGSKEQQREAIIGAIILHPFAYLLSWISVVVHVVKFVKIGMWKYKQIKKRNK